MKSTLIILKAPPASGKSTIAKGYQDKGYVVISSDELRGILGRDESDQTKNKEVFDAAHMMTAYFLARGQNVLIDACNVTRKSRAKFIEIGRRWGAHVVGLSLETPLEVCLERNKSRPRFVPEDVIKRMFAQNELFGQEVDEVRVVVPENYTEL
jgi:predicted kinase